MGRVYDVKPDESKGELQGFGCRLRVRLVSGRWVHVAKVFRVEFDDDTDEGPATVTLRAELGGGYVATVDRRQIASASFRCMAEIVHGEHRDRPLPERLWAEVTEQMWADDGGTAEADTPVVVGG